MVQSLVSNGAVTLAMATARRGAYLPNSSYYNGAGAIEEPSTAPRMMHVVGGSGNGCPTELDSA